MKNVYDEVRHFYEEELAGEPLISRELIEGFLRQKAWQGTTDKELRILWHNLQMFTLYLSQLDYDNLDDIPWREYSLAIEWIANHNKNFKMTLKSVRLFFNALIEFYKYLIPKKLVSDINEIEQAASTIAGGKSLKMIPPAVARQADAQYALTERIITTVSDTIEKLMLKLGRFFQGEAFTQDFQRALLLYTGPMAVIPEEDGEDFVDFWLGFWDYFLFDYHLLENDRTPLEHFQRSCTERLIPDEHSILQDLTCGKFTVFYVNKIISHDWVECVDLFTGEGFRLPNPEFDYKLVKRLVFFGHVFCREVVTANYITSVEMSINLRRRLKEEISRQKAIFEIQQPHATWQEFFSRHALAVRHTIDILATLAKVNVTPFSQIERVYPIVEKHRTPNKEVMQNIAELMPDYGFSLHDVKLVSKMWHDYSQLAQVSVRKPGSWAAAAIYAYTQVNSPEGLSADDLAGECNVAATSIYRNYKKITEVLQLEKFDPRYLSEEGLVLSLYAPY